MSTRRIVLGLLGLTSHFCPGATLPALDIIPHDAIALGGDFSGTKFSRGPNNTATLAERNVPAYKFYVDADANHHQSRWDELANTGWRMISLSVYGSPARYAAVWVQRSGPRFVGIHGADADTYQKWFDEWTAKGMVSTIVTVTGPANGPTYAGVMEELSVGSWQRCGLPLAEFETQNAELRKRSMFLKSFREYGSSANRVYCALWHQSSTFEKWNAYPTQSYDTYQATFEAEVQKRYWRPAYVTNSQDHQISSFFTDTSIGSWIARHGLTAQGVLDEHTKHGEIGLYPIQIQGGGSDSNTRFAVLFAEQDSPSARIWTVNGPAATGFADNAAAVQQIDSLMQTFMQASGVRQAQVAIGKAGRILLERAYTWAEPDRHRTEPVDRFLLASVSKMFVAGCIQHMYDTGAITPTTKVYPTLGYSSPADPRSDDITIEMLVQHSGGYDRSISPDPVLIMRQIALDRGGPAPASMKDIVDWVYKRPLDFDPGSRQFYSNYGYMLLSYLVERVSGQSYVNYLRTNVLNGLDVQPFATDPSTHLSEAIFQETMWMGDDSAHPTSSLRVSGVYGGDGIYKESAFGPSAMACSATTLVRYISTHGKYLLILMFPW
jgi:CubicO group peptidase (beta-lactamase class C family)